MAIFGLSGSGKSTLTHDKHNGKYEVSVLHDDALIISVEDGASVALEPSYFDKTADYPLISVDNKYLLSLQNCGVTVDEAGNKVVVCEDIRNKNGRAIKSKLWSDNRVDRIDEKVDTVVWLMKDPVLPPVVKINNPVLASAMGALLATKRTSAERVTESVNLEKLVIEPYANPFRTYNLAEDYEKFRQLFSELDVECYILNTGYFLDKKVTKEMTVSAMEKIVEGVGTFESWTHMEDMEIMLFDEQGFKPDMTDSHYRTELAEAFQKRLDFIKDNNMDSSNYNKLPDEAAKAIKKLMEKIAYASVG